VRAVAAGGAAGGWGGGRGQLRAPGVCLCLRTGLACVGALAGGTEGSEPARTVGGWVAAEAQQMEQGRPVRTFGLGCSCV